MKAMIRDAATVEALRPLEVASYLRATGWNKVEQKEGQYQVWLRENVEALLPLRLDVPDYALRMGDILRTLAEAEQRSQLAVFSDLLVTNADVLRVAIRDEELADGSMPIEEYTRTAQKVRDLMMAAACSAIERKPVWHKRKPDQAVQYLRTVRVGQTERGSYVLTVLSRVPPELRREEVESLEDAEQDEPYERKVTAELARALAAMEQAAENAAASGAFDSFDAAVRSGVSANLCEAVAGLASDGDTSRSLDFSFSWSPTRPVRNGQVSRVSIAGDRAPYVSEAARILKQREPVENFELEGPVIKLERTENAPTGMVTVYAMVDDSPRRIRMELPEEEYSQAIKAHGEGMDIRCEGELAREGRGYVLRNPLGFTVRTTEE
ncbi:MAG: hypothetical protein R6W89_05130 [Candidatus Hydrogenedentota bacterium]